MLYVTLALGIRLPVMLPVIAKSLVLINPAVVKLPPVMLPVALINPGVMILPLAILAVTLRLDTTFELRLSPAAFKFPAVTLPVVDIGLLPNAAKLAATLALP